MRLRPGPSLLVPLVLLGLTWAVYAPAAWFGFVDYDDPQVVTDHPHVRGGLTATNARWALTGFAAGHWEPLTWWSLQADVSAWHGRPGPMHVENALLHAVGSVVLYGLLATATGSAGRSAVVAALFAVHPMHVESVAWITERRDVLSTPPLLGAMWTYVRSARTAGPPRWAWFGATLGLYAVSLSAKATGMTLPAVLLLVDLWPLRRSGWPRLVVEKVPLALPAVTVAILAVAAQRAVGAASSLADLTVAQRVSNAIVTTVIYVAKLICPTDLAVIYPHPGSRPATAIVAAAALLVIATAAAWRQRRRRPYLLVGWLWFVVTLLPMSGLAQSGRQAMADRYAYLPSVGLFVAVVWAVGDAVADPRGPAVLATVVVAAFAVVARRQVGYWRDTETLFRHAVDVTDDNWVAAEGLGGEAAARGDWVGGAKWYGQALTIQPSDAPAYAGLAACLIHLGDPAGADRAAAEAVRLEPGKARYHVVRARTLSLLPGGRAAAVAECRAALSLDPANADARAGLAALGGRP